MVPWVTVRWLLDHCLDLAYQELVTGAGWLLPICDVFRLLGTGKSGEETRTRKDSYWSNGSDGWAVPHRVRCRTEVPGLQLSAEVSWQCGGAELRVTFRAQAEVR